LFAHSRTFATTPAPRIPSLPKRRKMI
jgi:hypothetical protein